MVRERRGDKLADDETLFTGMFWTAAKGRELGLVDEFGDMRTALKARYGEKVDLKLITQPRGLFRRPLSGAFGNRLALDADFAAGAAGGLAAAIEERLLWARYGL